MTLLDPGAAPPGRRRRWLWPAAVAAVVILVGLLSAVLSRTDTRDDLDPRSAGPGGSRAIAQILGRQGVSVDVVTRSADAVDGLNGAATVVVLHPGLLGPAQLRRLRGARADLVLVEPDLVVLGALAPGITPSGVETSRPTDPGCSDADARAAGSANAGGHLYRIGPAKGDAAPVGCYPDARRPGGFSVVRIADGDRRITLLGQPEVLRNDALAADGNAALALRVLGARPQVRWYLPDAAELGQSSAPTVGDLLPRWVTWVFWQLVLVVVVALAWRARRLGRVVTEPLPVVVRSAETVEGRARLYRAGRARGRAAAVLRTASARRLAARLGVPTDAGPSDVADLAAAATGSDPADVHELLLGDAPRDDTGLVALAGRLDALELAVAAPSAHDGERHPQQPDQARYPDRHDLLGER